jgi:hypothetical protein
MQHVFGAPEWTLLRLCLQEVLKDPDGKNFESLFGLSEAQLTSFLGYLNGLQENTEITLDSSRAIFLVKVMRESLSLIGKAEFYTRTGYKFAAGEALLAKLQTMVADRSLKSPWPIQ